MNYVKKKSAKQEKRTSKEFGGRIQVASGALWGAKGDVRTEEYLIENKFTDKDYYILKVATWNKIKREAIRDSLRKPLMQIDVSSEHYVVLDEYDYYEDFHIEPHFVKLNTTQYRLSNTQSIPVCIEFKDGTRVVIMDKEEFLEKA